MSYFRHDFGGDEDLERRYVAALKRAIDHTFRVKELEKGAPMTANELAEYIQDAMPEAATMLRQQQAELDAMKERNQFLESFYRAVKAGAK
jgi:hypothetical protein